MHTTYNDEKREALIRVSATRLHALEHIEAAREKMPSIKLSQEIRNACGISMRPILAGTATLLAYCAWKYLCLSLEKREASSANCSSTRLPQLNIKGNFGKKILSTLVMGVAAPYIKNKFFGKESSLSSTRLNEYIPDIDKIFFRWLGWEK